MSNNIILSIESSCDETAIAIISSSPDGLTILSNVVSSQVKLHAKWGGVVPNLAAREHVKNLPQVLKTALSEAQILPAQIDLIAVTNGPGLIPALLVGTGAARTLAYLWEKPLLGIHHIEGHIYANFISDKISVISNNQTPISKQIPKKNLYKIQDTRYKIQFPVLALVVSGGHTQLVLMKDHFKYEIIGQTLDDAVGEAFDKVARILGIGYPGGPNVARCARNFQFPISNFQTNSNDQIFNNKKNTRYEIQDTKYKIRFPRPMLNKPNFNFSFSGLKTAVLYETKKHPELLKDKEYIAEVCHEFQQACVDVLIAKTLKAAKEYQPKTIMLAGGVSANAELRKQLGLAIQEFIPNTIYKIPDTSLTGDNAAMIGAAAALRFSKMSGAQKKKLLSNWKTLKTQADLKMN